MTLESIDETYVCDKCGSGEQNPDFEVVTRERLVDKSTLVSADGKWLRVDVSSISLHLCPTCKVSFMRFLKEKAEE